MTCCVAFVGQHGATLVTTSATGAPRTTRVRGIAAAWTGMGMSTSLFRKLFPRLMQIQSTNDYNFFIVRHVGTSRVRHTTSATRSSRQVVRVVSWRVVTWRNKWNVGFACY